MYFVVLMCVCVRAVRVMWAIPRTIWRLEISGWCQSPAADTVRRRLLAAPSLVVLPRHWLELAGRHFSPFQGFKWSHSSNHLCLCSFILSQCPCLPGCPCVLRNTPNCVFFTLPEKLASSHQTCGCINAKLTGMQLSCCMHKDFKGYYFLGCLV